MYYVLCIWYLHEYLSDKILGFQLHDKRDNNYILKFLLNLLLQCTKWSVNCNEKETNLYNEN